MTGRRRPPILPRSPGRRLGLLARRREQRRRASTRSPSTAASTCRPPRRWSRLREEDRHHGQRPLRRRGRAGRPDRDRGDALAGRRVLHRELAAARVPGLQGPALARSTRRRWPTRRPSTTHPTGKWVGCLGPGQRDGLQHHAAQEEPAPTSAMDLAEPSGRASSALAGGETDFQPIVTSIARTHGKAAALTWLKALKANAGSHLYPDNETLADEVNRGQVALGIINQYYWYRERAEIGASNMHSAIAYFAPHDVGYVIDVSGAGILKSSTHQAAGPEVRGLPHLGPGPADHRPQPQLRVPDRLGRDHGTRPRRRSTSCNPTPSPSPQLGTGRRGDQAAAGGPAVVTPRQVTIRRRGPRSREAQTSAARPSPAPGRQPTASPAAAHACTTGPARQRHRAAPCWCWPPWWPCRRRAAAGLLGRPGGPGGLGAPCNPLLFRSLTGAAALEHRQPHGGGHGSLRRDRHGARPGSSSAPTSRAVASGPCWW